MDWDCKIYFMIETTTIPMCWVIWRNPNTKMYPGLLDLLANFTTAKSSKNTSYCPHEKRNSWHDITYHQYYYHHHYPVANPIYLSSAKHALFPPHLLVLTMYRLSSYINFHIVYALIFWFYPYLHDHKLLLLCRENTRYSYQRIDHKGHAP